MKISEPAADLGIALAIASSFKDLQLSPGLVAMGEIGLSGELRSVPNLERRIAEAARLGFKSCLVPRMSHKLSADVKGVEVLRAGTVAEALRLGLVRASKRTEAEI
jgi:DNA repair protein RadA/Sms